MPDPKLRPARDVAREMTEHRFNGEKCGSYTVGIEEAARVLEADRRAVAEAAVLELKRRTFLEWENHELIIAWERAIASLSRDIEQGRWP